MDIDLSDIIVSHLSPFFQVDPRKDDNFKLEVILQDSVVKVKVCLSGGPYYPRMKSFLGSPEANPAQINDWTPED